MRRLQLPSSQRFHAPLPTHLGSSHRWTARREARRVAFDLVFAYAGADFKVGSFTLPDYDRSLIDALAQGRDRIVLARFPSVGPAAAFLKAVGPSRVGVLDLQVESDGRVRSTAPLVRLPDGRIALG